MKKIFKNETGIALIVLVLTLVVLIILVGAIIRILGEEEQPIKQETEVYDKVYAKLYSYIDGSGDILEFSHNEEYEDLSLNIKLKEDYGNIGDKEYKYKSREENIYDENENCIYEFYTQEDSLLPPWLKMLVNEWDTGVNKYYVNENNIVSVKIVDKISPISTAGWFWECCNLEKIENLQYLDTRNVKNMSAMFAKCYNLKDIDVSEFDTRNVTDMSFMFLYCKNLTNIDVSKFDTKNVEDMSYMFSLCKKITNIDVSGFNTSKVTDMSYLFSDCENLKDIDVTGFDTSKVTKMSAMFDGCKSLKELDLTNFVTNNVTGMQYMFFNCPNLINLDISSFDTQNVKDMNQMFRHCSNLQNIYVGPNWTTTNAITRDMFTDCGTSNVKVK